MTTPATAQQLRLREHQLFLILTIVIGVLAGLSAVLFTVAIEQTSHRLFGLAPSRARLFADSAAHEPRDRHSCWPRCFPDVRGSGVPQTEAAYHLAGGVIPARVPFGKFITGVLCIGSGHSMGREGPSVQIGAGLASVVGRWLRLSPRRVRDLVPVGAAGALAAAFNTPVAAVLFALEEIIGDMNAALLGSTVVASVACGDRRAIDPRQRAALSRADVSPRAPGGAARLRGARHPRRRRVAAVLQGAAGAPRAFLRLPPRTKILQPAIGGLVIGAMLVFSPAIMGVGYEYVDQALNGGLLLKTMALLCFLKLGATIVSYASGNAGGIFAPSLYIGAMAGGAVGMLVHRIAPFPTGDPGAYALVGMGTLFAGIIRAPMTSVFMIFEITQDYQILVPLMVANMLSFVISRRYQPVPVYHALLHQDGVHLPSPDEPGRDGRAERPVTSCGPMRRFIPPDVSIEQAWQQTVDTQRHPCIWSARAIICSESSHETQLERWHAIGKATGTNRAQSSTRISCTCIPIIRSTSCWIDSPRRRAFCQWSVEQTSDASRVSSRRTASWQRDRKSDWRVSR